MPAIGGPVGAALPDEQEQLGRAVAGRVRGFGQQRARAGRQPGHQLGDADSDVGRERSEDDEPAAGLSLAQLRPTARASWALVIVERPCTFFLRASW